MMSSQICAVINLQNGSAHSWSLSWEECWSGLPQVTAAALVTGPLTGTGVPGGSGMTWLLEGQRCFAEGRAASALRYAGWSCLFLSGVCPEGKQADLSIFNGEVTVSYSSAQPEADLKAVYEEVLRSRPSGNSVILLPSPSGVIEDGRFPVSSPGVAEALLRAGVRSITVTGTGPIGVARPAEFRDLCVALWTRVRNWEDGPRGSAEHPVRYLSILPDGQSAWGESPLEPGTEGELLARLGLCWGPYAQRLGGAETAKSLLLACTGETWEVG